ncbi:MAG: 3-oxoacyl-[acyl-carrier-protein] reductase [Clostridia bacterium]|nr:3-oxoacyl-[acyl-carrier-protein] reductase [Clostridia bacterium]
MKMGNVAVVTGGTRGIGKQIILELAQNGYDIATNYRTENDDLKDLINQVEKIGVKINTYKCDVSNYENAEGFIKNVISDYGEIDVLVNNAGITKDGLLMRMKKEDFENVIDVNLVGTFNITRNVIPYMIKAKKGRIVNVSSVVGVSGNAGQTNYSASKAGIIGFTKSLAKEVASRNITVNAVAPGFIQTKMTDVLKEEVKDEILKQIPLKRFGTTDDVAKVVKFLVSEDSAYITGQVINIDGGMLM